VDDVELVDRAVAREEPSDDVGDAVASEIAVDEEVFEAVRGG
jgi:hypothetical protein